MTISCSRSCHSLSSKLKENPPLSPWLIEERGRLPDLTRYSSCNWPFLPSHTDSLGFSRTPQARASGRFLSGCPLWLPCLAPSFYSGLCSNSTSSEQLFLILTPLYPLAFYIFHSTVAPAMKALFIYLYVVSPLEFISTRRRMLWILFAVIPSIYNSGISSPHIIMCNFIIPFKIIIIQTCLYLFFLMTVPFHCIVMWYHNSTTSLLMSIWDVFGCYMRVLQDKFLDIEMLVRG